MRDSSRRMSLNSGADTSRGRGRSIAHLALDPARAGRHHHHAVGEEDRLLDRMGDEHHGQPGALPDLQQLVLQPLARHGVERAERLVHQHHLGVVGEHARDRDALLHAAGQLVRIGVGEALQADQLDEALDGVLHLGGRAGRATSGRSRCCRARSARETARSPGTPCRGRAPGPSIGLPHISALPARRLLEAGDDAQQRGLAAARGADQADELALADRAGWRRAAPSMRLALQLEVLATRP